MPNNGGAMVWDFRENDQLTRAELAPNLEVAGLIIEDRSQLSPNPVTAWRTIDSLVRCPVDCPSLWTYRACGLLSGSTLSFVIDAVVDKSNCSVAHQNVTTARMSAARGEPTTERWAARRSRRGAGWTIWRHASQEHRIERMSARPAFAAQF